MRKMIVILGCAVLMGCNLPSVVPIGTSTPSAPPVPQPTLTLIPTITIIPPSATATAEVIVTPTTNGTPRPELRCKVLSQSVPLGSKFVSRERFGISWQIQNTGSATWEPGVVDLVYAGGSKMYVYQPVELTHSSPPGDIIGLSADMVAPSTPDIYTMYWSLRRGDEYFCRIAVTIKVRSKD